MITRTTGITTNRWGLHLHRGPSCMGRNLISPAKSWLKQVSAKVFDTGALAALAEVMKVAGTVAAATAITVDIAAAPPAAAEKAVALAVAGVTWVVVV